ncbi:Ig-like domain-containing protein [Tenacibaculum sp. M341]|uniref:Ig-like domain-containing protein n=1 Tax=Tenacibaculum sp. M341 TaxID=2530339 RepID=UPI0014048530|nr:Ig-like domain-containing protein [Tenacibaculum sp. M341]
MKQLKIFMLPLVLFFLQSCIQDDVINDRQDENFSITNPIEELTVSETYQYTTKYTDNVGKLVDLPITWTSSDNNIATVSASGLVSGIAEGQVTITASVDTEEGKTITETNDITITTAQVDNSGSIEEKSGTIATTSSYVLTGTFTIKEIEGTNDLELRINDDYRASTALPGLYLYLTNNKNTVNNAKEIEAVSVFNGAHTYIIRDTGINDFSHLLYWCKPFGVKVGDAEIQ